MKRGRKYPLHDLLYVAGVPRSTYYYYLKQIQRPDKYCVEKGQLPEQCSYGELLWLTKI